MTPYQQALVQALDSLLDAKQPSVDVLELGDTTGDDAAAMCLHWKPKGPRKFRYTAIGRLADAGKIIAKMDKAGAIVALHEGSTDEMLERFIAERAGRYVPDVVLVRGRLPRQLQAIIKEKTVIVFEKPEATEQA